MRVLFRVDASQELGFGHLRRCLTLAQVLKKRDCDSIFLTKDYDGLGIKMIQKNGFKKIEVMDSKINLKCDFDNLKTTVFKYNVNFVVTDSYALTNSYYHKIKRLGLKILVINDLVKNRIPADIILNQNIYADRLSYSANRNTKLLLGPRYALIKEDFLFHRTYYKPSKQLRKILVTLGMEGCKSKVKGIFKIIKALKELRHHKFNLKIIGKIGPDIKIFMKKPLNNNDLKFHLKETVNNIWEDMLWADLVICAGGTTTYELCCLGIPFMTIVVADNQELNAKVLERKKISINLGWYNKLNTEEIKNNLQYLIGDYKRRMLMSKNGRELVDGRGAKRVLDIMFRMIQTNNL